MTGFLEPRRPPQHGAEVPASKPRAGTIWNPPSAAPGPPPQEGALGFNWGASRSPRVLDRKEVPLRSVPVPTAQGPVPARGPDCPRSFPNDPRAGAAHGARTLCRRLGTGREVGGSLSQGWPCFWAELNRRWDVQGGSPTSSSRPLCAGGALISPPTPGGAVGGTARQPLVLPLGVGGVCAQKRPWWCPLLFHIAFGFWKRHFPHVAFPALVRSAQRAWFCVPTAGTSLLFFNTF